MNVSTETIVQAEIELHQRFKNLDVIGFDMDLTAVNYDNVATGSLIYYSLMLHLVEVFPFFKNNKVDFTFCKRGLVIDMENGLILKLNSKKQVTRAYRGNRIVATSELDKIYSNASIESGPLKDYDGTHSARFFSMVSFFETPVTCIYKDFVVHLENEAIASGKDPLTIDYSTPLKSLSREIMNGFAKNFNDFTKGYYYEQFNADPSKFIYKASDKYKQWLLKIRSNGTKVLLVTNSKSEYCQAVMNYAFGENFKEYFDCIIVDAKKPEFFTGSKPFLKQLTYHPKDKSDYIPCDTIELNSVDSIFKNGNINVVLDKLRQEIGKKEISFCYVGDNILCDVVSPKQVKLMTVAIIEELQYPDEIIILKKKEKQQSTSTEPQSNYEWGSFFHVNDHNHENLSIDTYWSYVLKNHADIAVSTVDTLVDYYYADKFDNQHLLTPCAVVWSKEF